MAEEGQEGGRLFQTVVNEVVGGDTGSTGGGKFDEIYKSPNQDH